MLTANGDAIAPLPPDSSASKLTKLAEILLFLSFHPYFLTETL